MDEQLRDAHRRLEEATGDAIRSITNLAASMKVLEAADEHATDAALEASREAFGALADFLEAVARAAEPDGRLSERIVELLGEIEPLPSVESPTAGDPDDRNDGATNPFADVTPLRRLSAPYSILLNLEGDLYGERIRRPYRVRRLKRLWGDLSRIGSAHPSDGLAARLSRFGEYLDQGSAEETGAPWTQEDRESIRQLEQRAAEIIDWDEREVARRECEAWVDRVDDWVGTAEEEPGSVAQMSEMLTRFLTDLPANPTPDVRLLLERISELEGLSGELEKRVEQAIESLEQGASAPND